MSAIATAAMCLSLALGGESIPGAEVAELGGRLVEQQTGQPLRMPVLASVRAFNGDTCVAEARVDDSGRYGLQVTPGTYWLQVLHGNTELANEQVRVEPGSWTRDISVSTPVLLAEPALVARGAEPRPDKPREREEGIGGSGMAGMDEQAPPLPPLPPSPQWWEGVIEGEASQARPPWAPPQGG
jgi:hypothetical protein